LYAVEQGFELPAEEVLILEEGADYGWPQCYYDGQSQKLVLAPEYGATAAKRRVLARKSSRRSRHFPLTGLRTI